LRVFLKKPENFITDQGKEFDYINYLRKDGILYVIGYPKLKLPHRGNGNFIRKCIIFCQRKVFRKNELCYNLSGEFTNGRTYFRRKSFFQQALRQSFRKYGYDPYRRALRYNVTIVADGL